MDNTEYMLGRLESKSSQTEGIKEGNEKLLCTTKGLYCLSLKHK